MAEVPNPLEWQGRTMVDGHGAKVGKVDAIYVDDNTGDPAWALVHTGMFGSRSTFVPLREASVEGDDVHVPYEKSQIKDAPSLDAEEELSPDEERQLYDYYGVDYAAGAGHGHEGHDHEGHGHDHGHDGHDHDHEGHDHDHEHDAHDRGVGDPTPDQPVAGVEAGPSSGRPEVGQTVNPGQPVGGQVAAGAQQVGEKRLRRYTIVTEEVVREVIPVEDDAPGTEQPGPDQPPR